MEFSQVGFAHEYLTEKAGNFYGFGYRSRYSCPSNGSPYVFTYSQRFAYSNSLLEFIVQGHRYDIYEDYGCYPTTVNTFAAYPLTFIWPNVICFISCIYCGALIFILGWSNIIRSSLTIFSVLTLKAFIIRRAQFGQFVSLTTSLTTARYFRLMSLAMTDIFITIPLSTYGLYSNITSRPYYPWKSWSDTHSDWYTIDTYPAFLLRSKSSAIVVLELTRWSLVLCAFVFFAFFGFADEARKQYRRVFLTIEKGLGFNRWRKGISEKMYFSDKLPVFADRKLESDVIPGSAVADAWCASPTDATETICGRSSLSKEKDAEDIPSLPTWSPISLSFLSRSSRYTL